MQELEKNLMEYYNGNLSEADKVMVEEWVSLSKENKAVFDAYQKLYDFTELDDHINPDVDAAWEKVQAQMGQKKGKQVFIQMKYIYRVAAVLVFAMSMGILSYVVSSDDLTTVATKADDIQNITLPDGTMIRLNENATLRYDEDFDDEKRIVYLNGQAFFDVARDENRPFEIIGKSASISVLGTSFDFKSEEGFAQVNVNSGKVAFKSNQRELILTKNQQGKLENKELIQLEELDEKAIAWRFDELIFRSAPLSEVVGKLSEYYKVEFEIDPTIQNCLISTSFKNQSLKDALKVLDVIANIKSKKKDGVIQLTGPGC